MNYYKRHIGDYAAATRHLSMLEHGAYTLLLDVYYTSEAPLPVEERAVHRLVGARSRDEREAVTQILQEFFTLQDDGWHQTRCDEEIGKKQAKSELNREIGKRGGRPRKETETVNERNPNGFQEETQTVSENNPSHKPLANNHKPQENTSPQPPLAGGCTGTLTEKKAKTRSERTTLQTFLDRCRQAGEPAISGYEPLLRYMRESSLPTEFVNLCWAEFKRDFGPGGKNERKQQALWRRHFQNFVERNFYRLWYAKPQGDGVTYELTTVGLQAQAAHQRREAA